MVGVPVTKGLNNDDELLSALCNQDERRKFVGQVRRFFIDGLFDFLIIECDFRHCRDADKSNASSDSLGCAYVQCWADKPLMLLEALVLPMQAAGLKLPTAPASRLEALISLGSPIFLVRLNDNRALTLIGHPELIPEEILQELSNFLTTYCHSNQPKPIRTSHGARPRIEARHPNFVPTVARFIEDNFVLQEKSLSKDVSYTKSVALKDFQQHIEAHLGLRVSENTIAHKFLAPYLSADSKEAKYSYKQTLPRPFSSEKFTSPADPGRLQSRRALLQCDVETNSTIYRKPPTLCSFPCRR